MGATEVRTSTSRRVEVGKINIRRVRKVRRRRNWLPYAFLLLTITVGFTMAMLVARR